MYIPVLNISPYIKVTAQCTFPVLFFPNEVKYLSDSVIRIYIFLIIHMFQGSMIILLFCTGNSAMSPLIWSPKGDSCCLHWWLALYLGPIPQKKLRKKSRDQQEDHILSLPVCTSVCKSQTKKQVIWQMGGSLLAN